MRHIVVDLEMNNIHKKDPAKKICGMETIEFGAVMLDEQLQEIASFKQYVKPQHNTDVVPKVQVLTGIDMDKLNGAPFFIEALEKFADWCVQGDEAFTIYAWSDADYTQIIQEMKLKEYEGSETVKTIVATPWVDYQKVFDDRIGLAKQFSLSNALNMAGVEFQGQEHDALADAMNTAELMRILSDEKRFAETLAKAESAMNPGEFGYTIGSLFDFSSLTLPS